MAGFASDVVGEGRLYALKELARRAGVTEEFFRSWRIKFENGYTSVYLNVGSKKRLRFRNAPGTFWRELSAGNFYTSRASWMHSSPESVSASIPDFVIPFSYDPPADHTPLFHAIDEDCLDCVFDLPISVLLSLARWEETQNGERDEHGRFTAAMSVASRDGFLHRPIVDEYGLGLEQALIYLLPQWRPAERTLRVKLSHDIDDVGLPFSLKQAIGHSVRRHRPRQTVHDLVGAVLGLNPLYLESVRDVVQSGLDHSLHSAVYWKASPPSAMDTGYNVRNSKVKGMMSWLSDHGVEQGVHPGYETFRSPDRLRAEVEILQDVLGKKSLGGRQHYLRWCPDTWLDWESCGLAYDSSVGYADQVGFRAGTCIPYRPWLLSHNREANLIEIPLIVMEGVLLRKLGLMPQQSLEALLQCVSKCRLVGGVFTFLWHNHSLMDPVYGDLYERGLEALAGQAEFDWRTPSKELY